MKNNVVIGLGFGDEGKGLFIDYLCSKAYNPLVIRFSGGHQVGHTVVYNNIRHMFSNFGSGTLRGIPTYWSKFCTINPVSLIKEMEDLNKRRIFPILYIDERCPITTSFDIKDNLIFEERNNNGSVGVGFGKTIEREENFYSLTFLDLFYKNIFYEKLNQIKKYYNNIKVNLNKFIECCNKLIKCVKDNEFIFKCFDVPDKFGNYIFEGSQGLMLDQHFGFFPHVTRSNLGLKNIKELIANKLELFLITRAYQTRHGNGYLTNENKCHNIKTNPNESNVTNKDQGVFRRGLLDIDLLEYVINKDEYIRKNKNKNLVITCLDHIKNEYRFTYNNDIICCNNENNFIKNISNILKIENIYISHGDTFNDIKKFKD